MFAEFTFTEYDFDYKIAYGQQNNSITLCIVHNTEFLQWSKTITTNLTESTSEHMKITLTPKNLYNILFDYSQGKLPERYKVILPDNFKHPDVPLPIEIQSTMDYKEEWDIKIITLEPLSVPSEKRFELKLIQRDKQITALTSQIDYLTAQMKELVAKFDMIDMNTININTNVDMNTDVKNNHRYISKKEAYATFARIDDYYTKEESDSKALNVQDFYTKSEADKRFAPRVKNPGTK